MSRYDVVIIGGGAAWLSAASVLSRVGTVPGDLLAAGRAEITSYGADVVAGTVTGFGTGTGGFQVRLADGQRIRARRLLITTGLRDELPDVSGLRERWARDVLHCPYCHGHEVRDRRLGVLGGTPDAVRYAQIRRQWSGDLVYVTRPGTLTDAERTELAARGIGVAEGTVDEVVVVDDRLRGVRVDGGRVVPVDVLFVPPRFVPNDDLLVDPRAQVITAAGAGSAAIAINADLVEEDVRDAVRSCARSAS